MSADTDARALAWRAFPAALPSHADRRRYKLQCLMAGCLIGSLGGRKEFEAFVLGLAGEGLMKTTHGLACKTIPHLRTRSAAESPHQAGYCARSQSRCCFFIELFLAPPHPPTLALDRSALHKKLASRLRLA